MDIQNKNTTTTDTRHFLLAFFTHVKAKFSKARPSTAECLLAWHSQTLPRPNKLIAVQPKDLQVEQQSKF